MGGGGINKHAVAALLTAAAASVVLGAMTMSGFGSAGAGDVAVTSTPPILTVLLLVGVIVLIELQVSHMAGRRVRRTNRSTSVEAVRA